MDLTLSLDDARALEFGDVRVLNAESDSDSAFVVRTPDHIRGAVPLGDGSHLVGFSAVCTHMGCMLVSDETGVHLGRGRDSNQTQSLRCGPCDSHGTTFDLLRGGLVVLGPATQHLPQLRLEVSGDEIVAVGWLDGSVPPPDETWPCPIRSESD